jgi:hypothetical protein
MFGRFGDGCRFHCDELLWGLFSSGRSWYRHRLKLPNVSRRVWFAI